MTGSERWGEVFGVPCLELRDELLLLRTSVGASENEVCDLGISEAAWTGGGTVIGEGVDLSG
jgi:hypothetical protein